MIKPIICLALAVLILSQSSIQPVSEDPARHRAPQLVGGFHDIESTAELGEEELALQAELDSLARDVFSERNNGQELGVLKGMSTQVVAGMNYKLSYLRNNGEIVQITIYRDLQQNLSVTSIASSVIAN